METNSQYSMICSCPPKILRYTNIKTMSRAFQRYFTCKNAQFRHVFLEVFIYAENHPGIKLDESRLKKLEV